MADTKVSDLAAASASAAADLFYLVQGGASKKLTIANFLANLNSPVNINSAAADQDTRIQGQTDPALLFVDADVNRVGIGTATPSQKLHVVGNVHIQSGFLQIDPPTGSLIVGHGALGNLDVTKFGGGIQLDSNAGATVNLPDGINGQIFWFTFYSSFSGTSTLTVTHPNQFSTVTFAGTSANASAIQLYFGGSSWNILSTYGGCGNGLTVNC